MKAINILEEEYKNEKVFDFLLIHSKTVAKKAIEITKNVPKLNPNLDLIENGALLHDIGIKLTLEKNLGCNGNFPYVCHGYLGAELLRKKGLDKYATICETHVGLGITKEEIIKRKLPLPLKDFIPKTVEEEIVCLADKFYSKEEKYLTTPRPLDEMKVHWKKFGEFQIIQLEKLLQKYKIEDI